MLNIRRLTLLRELQLRGTLAEVAAAMHQSPSSVSQQLSLLEKEAGVKLLRRVGRKVQLTAQADILVLHTSAILERLEQAETDLAQSLDEATGSVRIAVFQSAALAFMPSALTLLTREHPRLRVNMTQREPETALFETWARDFDLVIAEQYPDHAAPWHPKLDSMDLTTDAIRLAVPREGLPLSGIQTLSDAVGAPWVMEPVGAASRHWAEQTCRQCGFEPDVRYETADLQAQIRLIESGNAVALLPDLLWANRQQPVVLHELDTRHRRTIFTSTRIASSQHPGIVACRAALSAVAEALTL